MDNYSNWRNMKYKMRILCLVEKTNIPNYVLDLSLIFAIIFNSNSVWALEKEQFSLSCFILLSVSFIYYTLTSCYAKEVIRCTIVPILVVMSATLMIQLVVSFVHGAEGLWDGTWFQYTLILPMLLGCLLNRGKKYVYSILLPRVVNVSVLLCFIGIVLWILSNFMFFPPTSTTILMWSEIGKIDSYYGLLYKIQPFVINGMQIYRNTSIFPEAPMAAVFYGITFFVSLVLLRNKDIVKNSILCVGLLTSFSTSAYIYIIFTLLAYFLCSIDYSKKDNKIVLSIVPVIILFLFAFVIELISNKINNSSSGMTHFFDFVQGFRIWGDAPVFGFGFESDEFIWQNYLSAFRGGLGYTSGMLFLAIHGGIISLLCVFIPLILWVINPISKAAKYFVVYMLIIFTTTVVQNCGIFILCLSLGYANFIWKKNDIKERMQCAVLE